MSLAVPQSIFSSSSSSSSLQCTVTKAELNHSRSDPERKQSLLVGRKVPAPARAARLH